MNRPMNLLEKYGALYNQEHSYNLSLAVRYPLISDVDFFAAVKRFQRKEKCLQVNVNGNLEFCPVTNEDIYAIGFNAMTSDEWFWELEGAGIERFSDGSKPLMRIMNIADEEFSEVIFTWSHMIVDGYSALLLMRSFEEILFGFGGELERKFENALCEDLNEDSQLSCAEYDDNHPGSGPKLRRIELGRSMTRNILEACKQNSTTLHGLLSATIGQAYLMADKLPFVKVRSQVNLRPLLGLGDVIGNYQIALDSHLKKDDCKIGGADTTWNNARSMRGNLREQIKGKRHIEKLKMLADAIKYDLLDFSINEPTVSVSTLGELPLTAGIVLGAATSHYAGPEPHIKAINAVITKKLVMMFQYDEGMHDSEFFERFSKYLIQLLDEAIFKTRKDEYTSFFSHYDESKSLNNYGYGVSLM